MTGPITRSEDRIEPPESGDERTLLTSFLDWQRQTLQWKCSGLTPDLLATVAPPPSAMSLLGMVRHMTEVEMSWFQRFDGTSVVYPYSSETDRDGEWDLGDPAAITQQEVDAAWARWHAVVDRAREVVARTDLDAMSRRPGRRPQVSMRWILIHMIEEYARHNGHADLIRDRLDGGAQGE